MGRGAEPPRLRASAPSLAIVLSTVLWGTLWIPLRYLDRTGIGGSWAATVAFTTSFVLLLPFGLARRREIAAAGRPLLAAGFLLAACIALYAEALLRGYVARVILLFYLTPVWSTLLARYLLGQPITRGRVATLALGLAGMLVVFGSDGGLPLPRTVADAMGLVSGFCWGWSMVYVQRTPKSAEVDKMVVQFGFLGVLFFLATLVPGGRAWTLPGAAAFVDAAGWLALVGVVWLPAVLWLTMFGGSRIEPGRVAVLLMLEVVIGLASAALLTDEPFGAREAVGGALIVAACGAEFFAPAPGGAPVRRGGR